MNPGQPVLSEAKDDGSGADNWSYRSCRAPVKSSPPTNQHPVFLQAGCPSCRPTNSVKALKGKYHIPRTCLPQSKLKADYNLQSMQCTVMLSFAPESTQEPVKTIVPAIFKASIAVTQQLQILPLQKHYMAPSPPGNVFRKVVFFPFVYFR